MSAKVAILMGSTSDLPKIQGAIDTLKDFGVPTAVRVMSAHRTPDVVMDFAGQAETSGMQVIIAAAGGAAHLAGVVAAHTILPVIGIPVQGGALNGMDALLATVQMPGGIAVATVGVGSGGPVNAALLAVQIMALQDDDLLQKLRDYRKGRRDKVVRSDEELQETLSD
ncbi:MAG: 5-(carboxyamino)imidazole ribonucleotide mutase [Lentisphaerae bacterium]|jgi:5-(carboxyamino)imidazole ribonucleotide mutase|nr:5-(carboxyamino)imidazole ribonucleotide mutase [Lentisphaerota bacterium]MBT4818181.1 5-(carboxyamino)imidazole ribonucleotide mutase [Lentisphaerota bacterium]MBT5610368.1 5-(carboxyamino)imidazole ribonucleotide mutase [Lentisphaerota bacterium]MBT7056196.1 5-(carboxyamino)imidazole ribonucleotide mutase [Lentisphaerota bacterium]MBT7841882.1 5-(carboxyamino)imidazole ribonucleotide mutase [Lentisphaerota bacterium]